MARRRIEQRIQAVATLLDQADEARRRSRLPTAIALLLDAELRLDALVGDDPGDHRHRQTLGSVLYDAGAVLLELGRADDAAAALERAETAYAGLAGHPTAPAAIDELVADVRLRRSRARAIADRAASALVDAQAGALTYLRRFSGRADDARALDVARALVWQAHTTAVVGDPDVAVAAADSALRIYLARASEVNTQPELRALHLPLFAQAARVAQLIHGAAGRAKLATDAAGLVRSVDPRNQLILASLPTPAAMARTVTVADAIGRAGGDPGGLTAPAIECRIRVPLERSSPELAPRHATQLAGWAEAVIDDDPPAGLRLTLEAHALLAGASEAGAAPLRYRYGDWGPAWVNLLWRGSRAAWAGQRRSLAHDLAAWMVGAAERLGPHLAANADARAAARDGFAWLAEMRRADGDAEGAQAAAEVLVTLGPA